MLRASTLFPFEAAITEAGAMAVMPSYNEIDGGRHKNRFLISASCARVAQGIVVSTTSRSSS